MIVELELNDADYKIIMQAKGQGTKIGNLELSVIGDIMLSNIKIQNGK